MMKFVGLAMLGLLVSFFGCQPSQPVVDVEAETAAVTAVLEAYIDAVEAEDLVMYEENVIDDESVTYFGVFGPPIVGWSGLRGVMAGQNDMLSAIEITAGDVSVHLSPLGDQAWATSLWKFRALMGEQPVDLDVRCTWVLEKQEAGWLIVHFHKSVTAG